MTEARMANEVAQALERLRDWGETIQRGDMRTVVGGGGETRGQWVGHEEFFADLAILEAAFSAVREVREAEKVLRELYDSVFNLTVSADEHHAIWRRVSALIHPPGKGLNDG